jgi:short-subunit dehydrogenase
MRAELKGHGINVIAVCLGPMDTEFLSIANIEKGTSHTFDTLPRVDPKGAAKRSLKASAKGAAVYTDRAFYKFYRFIAKVLPHSIVMKMSAT